MHLFERAKARRSMVAGVASLGLVIASLCLFRFAGPRLRPLGISMLFGAGLLAWFGEAPRYQDARNRQTPKRGYLVLIALGVALFVGLLQLPQSSADMIRHGLVVITRSLVAHR